MLRKFLHDHPDFPELIRIIGQKKSIDPVLVEKDYWIMACLYGLQEMGIHFQMKGGTSLSKGYGIIQRFSEDIDIRVEPPKDMERAIGRNQNKPAQCKSRKNFYDWLAKNIVIDGIHEVGRDEAFDDTKYRSGGIRLYYESHTDVLSGLKNGILLELGFDNVTPNQPKDMSSWAYDYAVDKVNIIDNRAKDVSCYHPGYTLVEKLQTVSTKYRKQQETKVFPLNFMRHYYDIYCLLQVLEIQQFIGTAAYYAHKEKRFRRDDDLIIANNPAFNLLDNEIFDEYKRNYLKTRSLYYNMQPDFEDIMQVIQQWTERL